MPERPPPVPNPKRLVLRPPPPTSSMAGVSVERKSKRPPAALQQLSETMSAPSLVQLTAMIDDMEPAAKRRFLRLIPVMSEALAGSSGEVNRRFVNLLSAILPVLKSSNDDGEKRIIELLGHAASLRADDQYWLIGLASRLKEG